MRRGGETEVEIDVVNVSIDMLVRVVENKEVSCDFGIHEIQTGGD